MQSTLGSPPPFFFSYQERGRALEIYEPIATSSKGEFQELFHQNVIEIFFFILPQIILSSTETKIDDLKKEYVLRCQKQLKLIKSANFEDTRQPMNPTLIQKRKMELPSTLDWSLGNGNMCQISGKKKLKLSKL